MKEAPSKSEAIPLAGEKEIVWGSPGYRRMKDDVVRAYDRAARDYDQVGTRRFQHFGRLLVERLDLDPGAEVLDLATGRGAILLPIAGRLGPEGRVIACDLSGGMVAETRRDLVRRGITNALVVQMDADDMAFSSAQFDAVTCGFALFFMDFDRVLPAVYEVLKPGGTFAVSVNHSVNDPAEYQRWKWLLPLLREVTGTTFRPPPACTAPLRLRTPERLEEVLTNAGFYGIAIHQVEATLYFTDEHDWWRHELSQGSRMWSDEMSGPAREQYKARAFEKLRSMREESGIRVVDGAMLGYATKPIP